MHTPHDYTIFITRNDGKVRSFHLKPRLVCFFIVLFFALIIGSGLAFFYAGLDWHERHTLTRSYVKIAKQNQAYERELKKYTLVQSLIKQQEIEASSIMLSSQLVSAKAPSQALVQNSGQDSEQALAQDVEQEKSAQAMAGQSAEEVLKNIANPPTPKEDSFTAVTDYKAKLENVAIREDNDVIQTAFKLTNQAGRAIAGHVAILIQDIHKKLHTLAIPASDTAFRIVRYKEYRFTTALPKGLTAVDVDKVVIKISSNEGEALYCNGFALE